MAKVVAVGFDTLAKELQQIADHSGEIASRALYNGAGMMADRIRNAVDSQQTQADRKHKGKALLPYEKDALQNGLTIEKFIHDKGRDYTQTAITFHGRVNHRTENFPDGMPTILLARAINKGTSFRSPNRFFINTVNKTRSEAEQAMVKTAEQEMKKHIK